MFDIYHYFRIIKKQFTLKDLFTVSCLLFTYFLTRLINLDRFPIFSDEGIYIRWAKVAWHDATWRFISLTDGKQPLQTWGTIPFLKLFPDNALLAGRLFSVSTGLFALVGIFVLLTYLWGKRAGFIGALIYIFTPYFLFYDRMALVDSGVNAFFIWILFLSILLARTERLDIALVFGLASGFGLLAKSSVRIFLGLSALAPVLFFEKNYRKFGKKLINFLFLFGIGIGLALLIYNVQRLSPFFQFVSQKNNTFVATFDELRSDPFSIAMRNIWLLPYYIFSESAFVLPVLGLTGLICLYKKDKRLGIYLTLWFVIPYIIVIIVSKVLFPRYVIFFASLFLIGATFLFEQFKKQISTSVLISIIFIISVTYFNYTLLFDFKNTPFPEVDRGQYVEGWTAGWGMKEIMQYAREKSHEKPVIILAQGNFGLAADVLDTFKKPSDHVDIRGYWPMEEKVLRDNQKELQNNFVFVVLAHEKEYPKQWPLRLIKRIDKPENKSVTYLMELTQ